MLKLKYIMLLNYQLFFPAMGLIHYSYAHITLFNFPCALGSQPCHLLFANGAGGVE